MQAYPSVGSLYVGNLGGVTGVGVVRKGPFHCWDLGSGGEKYEKYENGIWELGAGPCINAPVIFVLRSQVIELITLINH